MYPNHPRCGGEYLQVEAGRQVAPENKTHKCKAATSRWRHLQPAGPQLEEDYRGQSSNS